MILSSYDALQFLPGDSAGVALVLLAFVLLVVDLKVTNHGLPTAGGLVALVLGVLMLFNTMALSMGVADSSCGGCDSRGGAFCGGFE